MRAILCLVWLGSITAATTLAHADPDGNKPDEAERKNVAKEYVKAGIAAQKAGDYDTAITMFSKAYQLMPHPVLIFNSAQAHRLAGHKDRALAMYKRYLAIAPDGDQAQTAREWIAELEPPVVPVVKPVPAPPPPVAKPVPAPPPSTPSVAPAPPPPSAAALPASAKPKAVASSEASEPVASDAAPSEAPVDRTWKISLEATIGLTAVGAAFTTYELIQLHHNVPQYVAVQPGAKAPTEADCGKSADAIAAGGAKITNYQQFKDLCTADTRTKIGYVITGVGLVGVAVSTYMFLRDRHSREVNAARGHHPRHDLAIAPMYTKDSTGAMLSFTW